MKNIIVSNVNWAIWNKKTQEIEVFISTADLIAELAKRRPQGCPDKCKHLGSQLCGGCFWNFLIGENSDTIKDNFKEAI